MNHNRFIQNNLQLQTPLSLKVHLDISAYLDTVTCIENLKGEQGKKARLNLFCPGWSTTSSQLTGACSSQSTSSPTRQSDCFWVQPLVVRGQVGELIQGQAHSKCSYIDYQQNLRNFSLEGKKWVIRNCKKSPMFCHAELLIFLGPQKTLHQKILVLFRVWQPFGKRKNAYEIFVMRVFANSR